MAVQGSGPNAQPFMAAVPVFISEEEEDGLLAGLLRTATLVRCNLLAGGPLDTAGLFVSEQSCSDGECPALTPAGAGSSFSVPLETHCHSSLQVNPVQSK